MPVSRTDLKKLELINAGSFGKVYRVENFLLPGDTAPLAFKEFTTEHDSQAAAATAAVAFRAGLPPVEQAELDKYSAWPRELVEERPDQVCGFLMPLLPKEFFCRLIDPDTGLPVPKPRHMSWLIAGKATLLESRIDLPAVTHEERLFLMAQLAYAVGWLHKRRWVFGDLSFNNVVFAVGPPQIMLIDCDGAAALDDRDRKQYSTPFWVPPEIRIDPQEELQDPETDTYKTALAILRCLTPWRGASNSSNPVRLKNELDGEGIELITRALEKDPSDRPTTRDLYSYLRRVTLPLVAIPQIVQAKLATPFRLRGQPARIDWQLTGAEDITVLAADGFREDLKYADNPQGYSFKPDESGPVSIAVSNKYGTTRLDLSEVVVYDLPPFRVDLNNLPDPQIPDTEAFSIEPLAVRMTERPGAELVFPETPAIQSPDALGLVPDLETDVPVPVPWPAVNDVIVDVTEEIKDLILAEAGRLADTVSKTMQEVADG
jgi:hypothetical protein